MVDDRPRAEIIGAGPLVPAHYRIHAQRFEPERHMPNSLRADAQRFRKGASPQQQQAQPVLGDVNINAAMGAMSPTFRPREGDNVLARLMRNVGNGLVGAVGWHLWSYAQHVDIFGDIFRGPK